MRIIRESSGDRSECCWLLQGRGATYYWCGGDYGVDMERILCEEREKTRRYLGKSQACQNMRDAGVRNTRALIELYLFSGETDYVLNIQLYSQVLSDFQLDPTISHFHGFTYSYG